MQDNNKKYRLVTRANLDGIASAILLSKLEMIDDIVFTKEDTLRQEEMTITPHDIVVNLPLKKGAYLAFDHTFNSDMHLLNAQHILDHEATSAAEIIYAHYRMGEKFDEDLLPLIYAANGDVHGEYTQEEFASSQTWDAISALVDMQTLQFVQSFANKHLEYA